jgi:hypothetical protein
MFYIHILNKEELRDSVNGLEPYYHKELNPHRPKKNNLSSNGGL